MKPLATKRLYELVPKKPVARFFYRGTHTHPIRRTVLVIQDMPDYLVGYEFREGSTVRSLEDARKHVKRYNKANIAKYGDYSRLRQTSHGFMRREDDTTLVRESIMTMFTKGA